MAWQRRGHVGRYQLDTEITAMIAVNGYAASAAKAPLD
jgi:hypothetical protein